MFKTLRPWQLQTPASIPYSQPLPRLGIAVLLVRGDATFEPEVFFEVDAYGLSIGLYDVDRDSHLDVIVKGHYGQLHVLLGAGDGTLSEPTSCAFPIVRFVVSDFNGDERADLAGSITAWEHVISVMLGLGSLPAIPSTSGPSRSTPEARA
jgi:hypothetical protein